VYRQEKEQKLKTTSQEDLKYDPISTLKNRYSFVLILTSVPYPRDILSRIQILGSVRYTGFWIWLWIQNEGKYGFGVVDQ
jgi:hypothetical protein